MAEDIGNIYKTKIPSYAEAADIQAALKLFHYGTTTVPTQEDDILEDSLAGHLKDLQDQVTSIETIGIGSDFLTIAQIGSLTNPQDGYIAMASDSSGSPITTTYATAIYQNEAPTEDLVDGLVWVDKDSSPRRAYIYNEGSSSWDIIDDIQSVVNNAGDILYGTSNDTVSVLPIGTAGQVLKVNSGATAPEWADASSGGMTLISTTTLSNRQTDITSIPGAYNNLVLVINGANFPTYNTQIFLRPNGDTDKVTTDNRQNSGGSNNSNTTTAGSLNLSAGYNISNSSNNNTFVVTIYNYASSSYFKAITNFGYFEQSGGTKTAVGSWGGYASTNAITSITLYLDQNVNYNSGQVLLYGVK